MKDEKELTDWIWELWRGQDFTKPEAEHSVTSLMLEYYGYEGLYGREGAVAVMNHYYKVEQVSRCCK